MTEQETCATCHATFEQGECYMVALPWEDGKPKRHYFVCVSCASFFAPKHDGIRLRPRFGPS